MNKIVISFLLLACLSLLFAGYAPEKNMENLGDKTVIYLVRHAEKDTSNPENKDPDLTPQGYQRAEALKKLLVRQPVAAVFATSFRRTQYTVAPLAKALNLEVQIYQHKEPKALAAKILEQYRGKTVVVAGHSNSVLEAIEAFGLKRPVEKIDESQYSYLFKVVVAGGQGKKVKVSQYQP